MINCKNLINNKLTINSTLMKIKILLISQVITFVFVGCVNKTEKAEKQLQQFLTKYDSIVKPLSIRMNLASWNASISGKDVDFAKDEALQKQYSKFHSNKKDFKFLSDIKSSHTVKDSLLSRQLDVLYLEYLSNQVDTNLQKEIIEMQTNVEKKYNNFRAEVGGKKLTDNDVEEILVNSTDSKLLEATWEAQKKIGSVVSADILALVKKRNQLAKELGFKNFYEMSLKLGEQDPKDIENIFDELDSLTRNSFVILKDEIDSFLAIRDHVEKNKLMPWHYQNRFFQEAPKIYHIDLDKYYSNKNIEELTSHYYSGLGLPINDMLAKSDLYEKPGKNQHAFCSDIDYNGDTRVLCNIKSNSFWMNTMLHEFGHALYEKYMDPKLPFLLHKPAHMFATEAIAMMFGRQSSNPQWIKDNTSISEKEESTIAEDGIKSLRLGQLVFSRWVQVVYRFEKSMYENPDQDLNKLWWNLVSKYQMLKKPEGRNQPDWASKIHIATYPCYYHNYLLGEIMASQVHYFICEHILKTHNFKTEDYFNDPQVGTYLKNKIFRPGDRYYWNEMIERATNEKLTAKYYAKQFIDK